MVRVRAGEPSNIKGLQRCSPFPVGATIAVNDSLDIQPSNPGACLRPADNLENHLQTAIEKGRFVTLVQL